MENQSSAENNYNGELVDDHGGRLNDESQETLHIVISQEISQLLLSQPKKWERPRIQKVPPRLRERREQIEHVYDPVMVSLGPYHHGKQELRQAEEFKYLCLDWCAGGDDEKKVVFYKNVVKNIAEIRECYAEVTIVEKYNDETLALMMLLDACFIINFMHNRLGMKRGNELDWKNCLGIGFRAFILRDMMVLENQIPFQVLKLLISLQYEKEEAEGFLEGFFSAVKVIDLNHAKIPEEIEEPSIHYLEARWRLMTKKPINVPHGRVHHRLGSKLRWPGFLRDVHNRLASKSRWSRFSMREEKNDEIDISYAHRSVTDLKAKGIHFRPSSSRLLKDITFTSFAFYGQLQLPVRFISDIFPVIFSNMIAYELSRNRNTDLVVLSYVVFMKSLIQSPEDVKELQEKGILLNRFANLEKVVNLFKEIDTFGLPDFKHLGLRLPYLLQFFFSALLFCKLFLLSIPQGPMSSAHFFPSTSMPSISTAKAPFKNLESCSTMAELKQHHEQIIKLGLCSDNDAMGRVIKICALSESGDLNYALKVFALLPHPCLVKGFHLGIV